MLRWRQSCGRIYWRVGGLLAMAVFSITVIRVLVITKPVDVFGKPFTKEILGLHLLLQRITKPTNYSTTTNSSQTTDLPSALNCTSSHCEWLQEQETRKRGIRESCSRLRNSSVYDLQYELTEANLKTLSHFIVVDSRRLIFCYVPKVACTSLKKILLVLLGKFKTIGTIGQKQAHYTPMPKLSGFSLKEAKQRLKNYTTFMFTRDPFQRILSAYLDKFQTDNAGNRALTHNVIRGIQPYMDPRKKIPDRSRLPNVTFPEFIRYVSDPKNIFSSNDAREHWNEMYRMLQPCMVDYDYVGRFESLYTDVNSILKEMGLEKLGLVFPKPSNPTNTSSKGIAEMYIARLSDTEKSALAKRLEIDASMLNYSLSLNK